jgi:hypothetical protein
MSKKLFTIVVAQFTGNIISGNSSISNVSINEATSSGYHIGDIVKGSGIPYDSRITAISGTTITIDKNATQTTTGGSYFILSDNIFVKGSTATETVGGYEASEANVASTIVARDSSKNINVDSVTLASTIGGAGKLSFNNTERLAQLSLNSSISLSVGGDLVIPIYNNTGSTLTVGQVVYPIGVSSGYFSAALSRADLGSTSHDTIGVVAESIADGAVGFVTVTGFVSGVILDPEVYTVNEMLYLSTTVAGGFTNIKPATPNHILEVGWVKKVSTDSSTADGEIYVKIHNIPDSAEIIYDNTQSGLVATNVKGALDELNLSKADISLLSSSIILYSTTAASADVNGYFRMVTSSSDTDYNTTAVDVPTGAITMADQLIASSIADANLFVGNPGVINISTIGNIRKRVGNSNNFAEFFFKVFKRDSSGTETLIATSNTTGAVNPTVLNTYLQFSANAILNNGIFVETDRIVIKYFANTLGGDKAEYDFQFGGDSPVRTLLPVPVSVIPSDSASSILLDTTDFNGILSSSNTTLQSAMDVLDDHNHDGRYYTESESDGRFLQLSGGTLTGDLAGTNVTLSGYLRGPETFTIDPAGHGDDTGTVVIKGNLQVDGTTTTVNSTTLSISDKDIVVANGAANAAAANGAGILVGSQSTPIAGFTYNNTNNSFDSTVNISAVAGKNFVLSTNTDPETNNPLGTFDPSLEVLRGSASSAKILWKENDLAWKVMDSATFEKKIAVEGDTLDGGTY